MKVSNQQLFKCLAAGVIAVAAGSAFARPPQYTWRIPGVPDFDQKRGAIFDVPGLPNNGSMYCYPTSATNWANYIASRGYPLLAPGPGFKGEVYGPVYNYITEVIADMGSEMSTSGTGGTGVDGILTGTLAVLDAAYPGDFDVQFWSCSRGVCPNYSTITNNMRDGRLVILGIGWYSADAENPGNFNRGGGHAVSLTGADDYFLPSRTWRYTDPASDDGQLFNQTAPYVTHSTGVEMQNWDFNNDVNATLPRLMAYTSAFIDGYTVITAKSGWAARPDLTGIDQLAAPINPTHSNPVRPLVASFESPDGTPINEVLMHPQLDRVLVRTLGNPTTGHPGGINVCMGDGSVRFIRSATSVQAMVFSRNLELFILEGSMLSRYSEDASGNFQRSMVRSLTVTFDSMSYDDETDEVVCINGTQGLIVRFNQDLDLAPVVENLPPGLPASPMLNLACASGQHYYIGNDQTGELFHIARDAAGRSREHILLARQVFPELVGMGKLNIKGKDGILVSSQGLIREYRRTATGFERVTNSRFAGKPAGPFVDFSQSRTNFDPALHSGPGWENVLPTEFAPVVSSCSMDLNQNGVVDFGDITTVLSNYGNGALMGDPGDADLDSDVDFGDITTILANFNKVCD